MKPDSLINTLTRLICFQAASDRSRRFQLQCYPCYVRSDDCGPNSICLDDRSNVSSQIRWSLSTLQSCHRSGYFECEKADCDGFDFLLPLQHYQVFRSKLILILFFCKMLFQVYISKVCFMIPINVELPFLQQTYLRANPLYRKIFYEWAYTLVMFAIPFTILIVVNTMVIIAIHR